MAGIAQESQVKRITLSAGQLQKRKPAKLLPRQNYVVWCAVTKEKSNTDKGGVYIMGTFAHLEEAQVYVKEIHERGFNRFDIFISTTFEWLPFPPPVNHANPELRVETMQPIMRDIMGGHKKMNNDAADMIEARTAQIKEMQAEAKKRAKCQRYFNRCIAEVLSAVPIVVPACVGVGTGVDGKDVLMQQAEAELKRLEEEAKEEFEDEMKRLKGMRESTFGAGLKTLFARRRDNEEYELVDLERKEADMQREEEMKQRKKDRDAERLAAEREREHKKAAMIQALKVHASDARAKAKAATEPTSDTVAAPKLAAAMTLDEAVDETVPVEEPSLAGAKNRNRRRRKRQQAAKKAAKAAALENAASLEGLDAHTRYDLLVERLKGEIAEFDPDAGKAMTEEQAALERELRMQQLLRQLERERHNVQQQIKEESGAAEKEKELTPEEQKEMLRLILAAKESERTHAEPLSEEAKARLQTFKERREAIDRRKARVEKRKAAIGEDSILRDLGVKVGRTQTRKPKGLQD